MKKIFIMGALLTVLVFLTGYCVGIRCRTPIKALPEPGPLERVLQYSEWLDGKGHKIKFTAGSGGKLNGRSFSWEESGGRLWLNYLPQTELSRDTVMTIEDEYGHLILRQGSRHFVQTDFYEPEEELKKDEEALKAAGQELADFAAGFEGCKYRYGGKDPETGFDCSGLVYYVYDKFGYTLNRIAADQAKQGVHVEPEELMPGDLLCFFTSGKYIGHVGIYIGEGNYIHAMGTAYGVRIDSLDDPFLKRDFEARRMTDSPELLKENKE